jgi:hypothetical protein
MKKLIFDTIFTSFSVIENAIIHNDFIITFDKNIKSADELIKKLFHEYHFMNNIYLYNALIQDLNVLCTVTLETNIIDAKLSAFLITTYRLQHDDINWHNISCNCLFANKSQLIYIQNNNIQLKCNMILVDDFDCIDNINLDEVFPNLVFIRINNLFALTNIPKYLASYAISIGGNNICYTNECKIYEIFNYHFNIKCNIHIDHGFDIYIAKVDKLYMLMDDLIELCNNPFMYKNANK